jgi:SAM-dependent methyltransferase
MSQIENAFSNSAGKSSEEMQSEVAAFWNAEPCDSENSQKSPTTQAYYQEIEADRYCYQSHILEILSWLEWQDKSILEIGTGVGADARQVIARGANYHGINVDAGTCETTRMALKVFELVGEVHRMSATEMSFESNTFDTVYSFGVLHHIPDVQKAISSIHRVLKPNGHLLFMVYNRSSINYRIEIRHLRKWMLQMLMLPGLISLFGKLGFPKEKLQRHVELSKKLGKMSDAEWLSRNTDGPDNPYSLVYGRDEIAPMLGGDFRILRNEVYYFDWRHWGVLGRVLPKAFVRWLGKRWGWHRVVLAQKI